MLQHLCDVGTIMRRERSLADAIMCVCVLQHLRDEGVG